MKITEKTRYAIRPFDLPSGKSDIGCHLMHGLPSRNSNPLWSRYCGFMIVRGSGVYRDWNGKETEVGAGDFCQHLPGLHHVIERDQPGGWIEYSLTLGSSLYEHFVALGCIDPRRPVVRPGDLPGINDRFLALYDSLSAAPARDLPGIIHEAQGMLLHVFAADTLKVDESAGENIMELVCDRLSINLDRKLDLQELAGKLNMSYSHFRRTFKDNVGVSPAAYRLERRLEQAGILLAEGRHSVNMIASMLGYADQFVFSRQFKRWSGLCPREYSRRAGAVG